MAIGEDFTGHSAQIATAGDQFLEARGPRPVGGEPERQRPAAAEDAPPGIHPAPPVGERPAVAEERPVGLGLDASTRLEPNLWVADLRGPETPQLPGECGIAAQVPVVPLQLNVEVSAPNAGADGQAALDVAQLSFGEGGRFVTDWIAAGSRARDFALHGPPVQPELAS